MSPIRNNLDAFNILKTNFNFYVEEFWIISLNSQLNYKEPILISRGTLNYCLAHPRDIFREALKANSHSIIVAHNHPSLNPTPTPEDIKLTKKLVKIGNLMQIPVIDHIVFTDKIYFSFKENNLL